MPTRKQRKRMQKERRHEYETVWVDSEGNELDEPPDDAPVPAPAIRSDAKKSQEKRPQRPQRPQRASAGRAPLPPSWRRAGKRSLIIAVLLFVFVYATNSKVKGAARIGGAVEIAALYSLLFTPFMYYLDKFTYARWEKKASGGPAKR